MRGYSHWIRGGEGVEGGGGWYTSHSFAIRKPPCSMWSFHLIHVVPLFQDRKPSSRWYRTSSLWNCSLIPWCSSPFRDGDPPKSMKCSPILLYRTSQSILMFLNAMIQSLLVHNVVYPFHDKHILNLSNCSKFHDTEPSSPWFCSPVPHLTVFNAIPPFHGTEPPSSWYYSPIPWCYSPIPFQETVSPWICSPIPWYRTNPFHDGVAPFHNTDSHIQWRNFHFMKLFHHSVIQSLPNRSQIHVPVDLLPSWRSTLFMRTCHIYLIY